MADEAPRQLQPPTGEAPPADPVPLRDFRQAPTTEAFYQGWLATQCRLIPGVSAGAVFRLAAAGPELVAPVALWGEATRNPRPLTEG